MLAGQKSTFQIPYQTNNVCRRRLWRSREEKGPTVSMRARYEDCDPTYLLRSDSEGALPTIRNLPQAYSNFHSL